MTETTKTTSQRTKHKNRRCQHVVLSRGAWRQRPRDQSVADRRQVVDGRAGIMRNADHPRTPAFRHGHVSGRNRAMIAFHSTCNTVAQRRRNRGFRRFNEPGLRAPGGSEWGYKHFRQANNRPRPTSEKLTTNYTHRHTHTQPFNGPLSGTTRVGQYQKKHSPTHTHPDHQTFFINFLHLLRFIASSLFSLHA